MGGGGSKDYPDQTPVLLGANPSLRIDWANGPDSFGVAKLKMGTSGTQWRRCSPSRRARVTTPPPRISTFPASGSGFTKAKLKGRIDWSALDSFDCTTDLATRSPGWILVNNGDFIVTIR